MIQVNNDLNVKSIYANDNSIQNAKLQNGTEAIWKTDNCAVECINRYPMQKIDVEPFAKRSEKILQQFGIEPDSAQNYKYQKPERVYSDNGYKCSEYKNPDGTITIVREKEKTLLDKIKEIFIGKDGTEPKEIVEKYDENGNLVQSTTYSENGDCEVAQYKDGQLDKKAKITQPKFRPDYIGVNIPTDEDFGTVEVEDYNPDGSYVKYTNLDKPFFRQENKIHYYDKDGKEIPEELYQKQHPDGKQGDIGLLTPDLTSEIDTNQDGRISQEELEEYNRKQKIDIIKMALD